MEQCQGPGQNGEQCRKVAVRAGLCEGHREQKYDERPLTPLRKVNQTRLEMLREAAIAYADAADEDEAAFRCAVKRLIMAAKRYSSRPGNEFSTDTDSSGRG